MTYLYAIKDTLTGLIKLGYSYDPTERIRELQTGSAGLLVLVHKEPVTENSALQLEKKLHRELSHLRRRGEWFECDEEFARLQIVHHIIRWGNGLDDS